MKRPATLSPLAASDKLSLVQLTYMRAIAQGLSIEVAARRFLELRHGAEIPKAHRLVVDQVAAVARRRGDPRWRLLGLMINDAPGLLQLGPPLEEWAESEGLDGFDEREPQELYLERFGQPSPQLARCLARNERLTQGRLALLRELEDVVAIPATPNDLLAGWLAPALAEQMRRLGLLTLANLQRRTETSGRWWRNIPAYGTTKAARLATYLTSLVGVREPPYLVSGLGAWADRLDGSQGVMRATGQAATSAANDRQAIEAWIEARVRSPATQRAYRREAERFLLWMILERQRAMSDATVEDCAAYMAFVQAPPDHWVSHRRAARLANGWAPFKGPLGPAALSLATTALHSIFDWLVKVRYLTLNPWAVVNRRLGDDPRADLDIDPSRAFTRPEWKALQAQIEREANSASASASTSASASASAARIAWLLQFGQATGLRPSELVAACRGDMRECIAQDGSSGWFIRVHGKGRKNRLVTVPSSAVAATRAYFVARGGEFEAASADAPLLTALKGGPLGYRSLHETLTRFVRRAVKASSLSEEALRWLEDASTHWLRHTHATRAAESGLVPLDVLQENLGHEDPRTTSRYYRAQIERRQAALEKVFGEGGEAEMEKVSG